MNQFPYRRFIGLRMSKQPFGGFGVGAKIGANKIGDPLGAGEIEILF
jgi:hypothetical protein